MKQIKKILDLDRKIIGINARNRILVYPNNRRRDFIIANDKAVTKEFLLKYNIPHPTTYAIIERTGDIYESWKNASTYNQFVIKPAKGKGGGGILALTKGLDKKWKTPSGKLYTENKILSEIANIIFGIHSFGSQDRAIIEQLIISHAVFSDIFPKGVADIRLITYKSKLLACMLRIPTNNSDGKANLHQGAIGVSVDIHEGILQKAYNYKEYLSHHPDTKVKIEGIQLPFWKEILNITNKISKHSPLGYLGIDIVIDHISGPLVLEINARPGIEIQNVIQKGFLHLLAEQN